MSKRLIDAKEKTDDKEFDVTLRPRTLGEYIGQSKVKENLIISIKAAKARKESLEHVLIHGCPGLGKTSLAHIIAREMDGQIKITSGPALERAGDLAAILTNLSDGDILFIDECHRLNRTVEELLYPAMEDYALDLILGKGPSAKTIRLDLPKFTLIGATTRISLLSSPLRDRFGISYKLNFYAPEEIQEIINRSAKILKVEIEPEAAGLLAKMARSTPRVANRLLRRVRDYAQVKGGGKVEVDLAKQALEMLSIDSLGLDETDRQILETIISKFAGGPVGLNTISAVISEEMATIEDIYEPYLQQIGFLVRTPRGRVVTEQAYKHLGLEWKIPNNLQAKLI